MKLLDKVSKGPKGLVRILNGIISVVNGMKLTGGGDIYITPNDCGWLISTNPSDTDSSDSSKAIQNFDPSVGVGLSQRQIDELNALNNPPASPVAGVFTPWVTGGVNQNSGWLGVTVVNASCVQSVIAVWAKTVSGGGGGGL